jgi:tRNA(fMet)-specific endonuclease VapC
LTFTAGEIRIRHRRVVGLSSRLSIIDINNDAILQKYAEIDAFSQGKLFGKSLPIGMSARNMGKNDLWIAATASIVNVTLLTTDMDFDHLNGVFLPVIYIDPATKP